MAKLSANAAIAQQVERILGKDEVASSNLASSSKKERPLIRVVFSFFGCADLKISNATVRWTVADTRANTDGYIYFIACTPTSNKMQTNLLVTPTQKPTQLSGLFVLDNGQI